LRERPPSGQPHDHHQDQVDCGAADYAFHAILLTAAP
jgi:hypothetical protein